MSRPVSEQPPSKSPGSTEMRWFRTSPADREQVRFDGRIRDKIRCELEILKHTDQVTVQQAVETVGAGCDVTNTYLLSNEKKEKLFLAVEDTSCCARFWCGPARSFRLALKNQHGDDVIHFVRPLRCDACCCPCCMMRLMIQTPSGEILGYTKQTCSLFGAAFKIEDADKNPVMTMWTSCCPCRCFTDLEVQVQNVGSDGAGLIRKQWGGRKQDTNMDHETFVIQFPPDCDSRNKMLLIGAAFLVHFMFFEMT